MNANGYLYLIIGPMFAGKSSKLIRLIRNFKSKEIQVLSIKHSLDIRYGNNLSKICTHDLITEPCQATDNLIHYLNSSDYKNAQVIIIEEAQFFGQDLINFCTHAVDIDHKYLIVTGLSGDYKRNPFGLLLNLIPLADQIEKLEAYCHFCLDCVPASFTAKISGTDEIVQVGQVEIYQPVCRKLYLEHGFDLTK